MVDTTAGLAIAGTLKLVEITWPIFVRGLKLVANAEAHADRLKSSLQLMQSYLREQEGTENNFQWMQDEHVTQIRKFAYQVEDILDECRLYFPQHFHRNPVTVWAHNINHGSEQLVALGQLSSSAKSISDSMTSYLDTLNQLRDTGAASNHSRAAGAAVRFGPGPSISGWTQRPDELVGLHFKELRQKILKQLVSGGTYHCRVISVVGPSGSGKTALIDDIYRDSSILRHFGTYRAWVSLPHFLPNQYEEDLVGSIMAQFRSQRDDNGADRSEELVRRQCDLKQYLRGKRYLVVLDDVLNQNHLQDIIQQLIPSESLGSRIIVISCHNEVSSFLDNGRIIHQLGSLSSEEARYLFCKKAFPTSNGKCPKDLADLAELIIKKCELLSGHISVVGCMLSSIPQIRPEWMKFMDGLGRNNDAVNRSILSSYNGIRTRSYLKSCFLYFAVLPEDYSIRRERLIRLWIAEGFVTPDRNRSQEEVAEEYLKDMVSWNLVVCTKDVDDRVRSCRVTNLVREFLISMSDKENFVSVIADNSPRTMTPPPPWRRLSLVADNTILLPNVDDRHPYVDELRKVRSGFVFGKKSSLMLKRFKLLKVLDMQSATLTRFPKEILNLLLLKYLSLEKTEIDSIPPSIKYLSLLETLNLKQTRIRDLPLTIFRLRGLRHLLVYSNSKVRFPSTFDDDLKGVNVDGHVLELRLDGGLEDMVCLEKLSLVKVNDKSIIKALRKLTNLRKLGIVDLKGRNGKALCKSLQKMCRLSSLDVSSEGEKVFIDLDSIEKVPAFERTLRRLQLKGRLERLPGWVTTLHSLMKITLKWSRMKGNSLDGLECLPSLMELVLVDAYTGNSLQFRTGTFQKLKILQIEQMNQLNMVLILQGTMPNLKTMRICRCRNMRILPSGIEGLLRLEELLVYDMHEDFNYCLLNNPTVGRIPVVESTNLQASRSWTRPTRNNPTSI